jgi:hypothetical protein
MVVLRYPWESGAESAETPLPPGPAPQPRRRGRRPAARGDAAARQTEAAPCWLYHHLTVTGPAGSLAAFAAAARGSGVAPWLIDAGRIEEDVFNLAASQPPERRNLTIAGCRILARQFRERVEERQARARMLVGCSRACPFDLHQLLPVPPEILALGPTHPASLAWLSEHWGTTDRLRQVAERQNPTTGRRLPEGHAVIGYGFFTAGETLRAAIDRLAGAWPDLRFTLQPRPPG